MTCSFYTPYLVADEFTSITWLYSSRGYVWTQQGSLPWSHSPTCWGHLRHRTPYRVTSLIYIFLLSGKIACVGEWWASCLIIMTWLWSSTTYMPCKSPTVV